jgi:hypothetical protein
MGTTSWRGQIDRALSAIDRIGTSKYAAKQERDWTPGASGKFKRFVGIKVQLSYSSRLVILGMQHISFNRPGYVA